MELDGKLRQGELILVYTVGRLLRKIEERYLTDWQICQKEQVKDVKYEWHFSGFQTQATKKEWHGNLLRGFLKK